MKFSPSVVIDAPGYYVDHFNGKHDTDKIVILRDKHLEVDSEAMGPSLRHLSNPTNILDLTNNSLNSFPSLASRSDIHTLLLSRNNVKIINGRMLPPSLVNLVLAHNAIDSFEQLKGFKSAPSTLTNLSLIGNPICHLENYRLHVIQQLPKLQILDFTKVKAAERKMASELTGNEDIKTPSSEENPKKRRLEDKSIDLMNIVVGKLSDETKLDLKRQLLNATSLDEIEKIEKLLKGGV